MNSSKNQQNKQVLSKIGLTILITLGAQSLQAEVTETQQAVLDHYAAMKEMSGTERKNYRKELFSGMSRAEQRSFQKAFKEVRAMIPSHLNIEDVSNTNKKSTNHHKSPAVRTPGTSITYDTGTVFGTAGIASQMVGNRFDGGFNSNTGMVVPVETSGSITMITFDMVNTFFSSAVFSLYSNINGTMADQVTSMAIPGIMTGLNTISVMSPTTANAYSNGTFLAGIWQFDPTMTALAVDTVSANGQGFHAISLNDGAVGTMLTTVTTGGGMGLNAIFRVSGDVLQEMVPVELIDFTIEKDSE